MAGAEGLDIRPVCYSASETIPLGNGSIYISLKVYAFKPKYSTSSLKMVQTAQLVNYKFLVKHFEEL